MQNEKAPFAFFFLQCFLSYQYLPFPFRKRFSCSHFCIHTNIGFSVMIFWKQCKEKKKSIQNSSFTHSSLKSIM